MNKKGFVQITLSAIVLVLFQMWVVGLMFNAIEPEIEKMLLELNDNALCPPELNSSNYQICFGKQGEVFVEGIIKKAITIEPDEGIPCYINEGKYNGEKICTIDDFWKTDKLYIKGLGMFNKKTIKIATLLSYTKSGRYIKALKLLSKIPK